MSMTLCDRCQHPIDIGAHGLYVCPLEPRRAPRVRTDTIPGGRWLYHGLCNPDGTPRRYDSESEITRACAEKGLTRWTDIHEERSLNGAREHADWIARSAGSKAARAERVELRRQKASRR